MQWMWGQLESAWHFGCVPGLWTEGKVSVNQDKINTTVALLWRQLSNNSVNLFLKAKVASLDQPFSWPEQVKFGDP